MPLVVGCRLIPVIIPSMRLPSANLSPGVFRRNVLVISLFIGILFILAALTALSPTHAFGAGDEPTPEPTSWISPDRLEPYLPENPSLADKGAAKYWAVCMACHGDRGQGLTDEWRERGFGEDMNCWQSKCHATNHPPDGFTLVRVVPPAIGPTTLRRFTTAAELHDYLLAKMPWWNPGSLTSEEAWQLTAFLLREDGLYPRNQEFNVKEAGSIPVHLPYHPQTGERAGQWVLFGSLGLAAFLLLAGYTRHARQVKLDQKPASDQAVAQPTPIIEEAQSIPIQMAINPNSRAVEARLASTRPNFLHHLHPPTIPLPQARWRYTLGTGGLAVFLTLLLGVTGTLEMFFYIPTPEQAGSSVQVITFLVPFGGLVRGLHFWAAQALVVVSAIHLLRILFTGAYAPPRRFNFLLGLGLFVLALMFDFTGYVLRWDEGIRWALMVGTNLLKTIPVIGNQLYGVVIGGAKPGLATLTRFYTWHIFGLTLIMAIILVWHLFRVRRDGGVSAPPPELRSDPRRITRYELVQREVLAMLIASLVLILVSLLLPAPLAPPIQDTPIIALSEVRAPWFFLWIQQLLRYGNAFWMGVAVPLALLAVLVAIPYIFPRLPDEQRGRWFPPAGRAAQLIGALIALGWLVLTLLELATKTQ
jgi:quinol-cytochrome oxidoreductase complex cytochrome b subunit